MRHRWPMSIIALKVPEWHLRRESSRMELQLTGDWVACQTGIRSEADVHHIADQIGGDTLRINSSGLGRWDGALIAFLKILRETISDRQQSPVRIDESDLPEPAKRLLALACASRSELRTSTRLRLWWRVLARRFIKPAQRLQRSLYWLGRRHSAAVLQYSNARGPAAPTFSSKCVRQELPHSVSSPW